MEEVFNRESTVGQLWLASHWLSKLTKQTVVKFNVSEHSTAVLGADTSLRRTGYLLLGLVRILSKKLQYILHEVSSLLDSFVPRERPRRQVFTTVKPKRTKAFTSQLSSTSFKGSRGSIEQPRNLARVADITIPDSYQTPVSAEDVPIRDEFLGDIASLQGDADIQIELFRTPTLEPTPVLSESRARRRLSRKRVEPRSMKRFWVPDSKLTIQFSTDSSGIVRPLNAVTIREVPLNSASLFNSSIIKGLPKELNRFFQDGVWVNGIQPLSTPFMDLETFEPVPDLPEIEPAPFEYDEEEQISWKEQASYQDTARTVRKALGRKREVKFDHVFRGRTQAARGFYDLLMLASRNEFGLVQTSVTADILIRPVK